MFLIVRIYIIHRNQFEISLVISIIINNTSRIQSHLYYVFLKFENSGIDAEGCTLSIGQDTLNKLPKWDKLNLKDLVQQAF